MNLGARIAYLEKLIRGKDIVAIYRSNTAQTMTGGSATNVVITEDKVVDDAGIYNSSTGVMTAPKSGRYFIFTLQTFNNDAWVTTNSINLTIRKNGAGFYVFITPILVTATFYQIVSISGVLDMIRGDTMDITIDHNRSAGNTSLVGSTNYQYLCIFKI